MDDFKSFNATIDGEGTVILGVCAPEIPARRKPVSEIAAWVDGMITAPETGFITDSITAWDKAFKKRQLAELSWGSLKANILVESIQKLDDGKFEVQVSIH